MSQKLTWSYEIMKAQRNPTLGAEEGRLRVMAKSVGALQYVPRRSYARGHLFYSFPIHFYFSPSGDFSSVNKWLIL